MNAHIQRTLIILKPDSVQRALVGEVLSRFERVGLKIIAMRMTAADSDTIEKHYLVDPEWKTNVGKKQIESKNLDISPEAAGAALLNQLQDFMTAGPIIVAVIEGAHAIPLVRKLVGGTEPLTSDVGTIRGDYVMDSYEMSDSADRSIRNIIHASSSIEDAVKEIKVWFNEDELIDYKTAQEDILYGDIHAFKK